MQQNNETEQTRRQPRTEQSNVKATDKGKQQMGGFGYGLGGHCVCAICATTIPHQKGLPCSQIKCPQCGASMTRTP